MKKSKKQESKKVESPVLDYGHELSCNLCQDVYLFLESELVDAPFVCGRCIKLRDLDNAESESLEISRELLKDTIETLDKLTESVTEWKRLYKEEANRSYLLMCQNVELEWKLADAKKPWYKKIF